MYRNYNIFICTVKYTHIYMSYHLIDLENWHLFLPDAIILFPVNNRNRKFMKKMIVLDDLKVKQKVAFMFKMIVLDDLKVKQKIAFKFKMIVLDDLKVKQKVAFKFKMYILSHVS